MNGDCLHQYDLRLCAYGVDNLAQHLDRPSFAARVEKILAAQTLLLAYVKNATGPGPDAQEARLLLGDREFQALELVAECAPELAWEPHPALHRRFIETIKDVRDGLSRRAAEDWSEECAGFARELEAGRLRLAEGIEITRRWVRLLRYRLRVMGAVGLLPAPEGSSPTPTHPTPAPPAPNKPPTNPAASQHPDGALPRSEPAPGLAAVLTRLADAVNKIGAPAAPQLPPPEALSKEDAAKFLGVPAKTIEHLIRARKVRYVQLGAQRGRVIPVEALRKLLQEKTQLTAQEELQRRGRR